MLVFSCCQVVVFDCREKQHGLSSIFRTHRSKHFDRIVFNSFADDLFVVDKCKWLKTFHNSTPTHFQSAQLLSRSQLAGHTNCFTTIVIRLWMLVNLIHEQKEGRYFDLLEFYDRLNWQRLFRIWFVLLVSLLLAQPNDCCLLLFGGFRCFACFLLSIFVAGVGRPVHFTLRTCLCVRRFRFLYCDEFRTRNRFVWQAWHH